jgi:hypothetical protein
MKAFATHTTADALSTTKRTEGSELRLAVGWRRV